MKKIFALLIIAGACSAELLIKQDGSVESVIIAPKPASQSQITQTVTDSATSIPSGAAVTDAFESWIYQVATNPVVQTVAEGDTNNVIAGSAVKDALEGKVSATGTESFGVTNKLHIMIYPAQSNGNGVLEDPLTIALPAWAIGANTMSAEGYEKVYYSVGFNGSLARGSAPLTPQSTTQWGAELFGGPALAEALDRQIYISKAYFGGTQLQDFLEGATVWTNAVLAYNSTISTNPSAGDVDVIWWIQGESGGTDYAALIPQMIEDIQNNFGSSNTIPVVFAGLGPTYTNSTAEAAMLAYCNSNDNAVIVRNFDLTTTDVSEIHYDSYGQRELGYRMAQATLALLDGRKRTDSDGYISAESDELDNLVVRKGISTLRASIGEGLEVGADGIKTYGPVSYEGSLDRRFVSKKGRNYEKASGSSSINFAHLLDCETYSTPANNMFAHARVFVAAPSIGGYYHSVKLLDSTYAYDQYRYTTVELSSVGSSRLGWKRQFYTHPSSAGTTMYGTPKYPSGDDNRLRFVLTLNENVSVAAGDKVECGSGSFFISDRTTATNAIYVREFYDFSGYALDTNTPIKVTHDGVVTTNETARISSANVAADFRSTFYVATDGYYYIPAEDETMEIKLWCKVPNDWTWESGD